MGANAPIFYMDAPPRPGFPGQKKPGRQNGTGKPL